MARLLKGKEVADALTGRVIRDVTALKEQGVTPTLCILRAGERQEDLAYEKGAMKRAEMTGVAVKHVVLPEDVPQDVFDRALTEANDDEGIHGILMCLPLPAHLDSARARAMLKPEKDVDGCTDASLAGVFAGKDEGFPPCTAQAVIEILRHYGIGLRGKNVVVIGRSLVIGRPVAMLLMHENATVTICHTQTRDIARITRDKDILIAAAGKLRMITKEFTDQNQVVIDVGINWDDAKGAIAGDVDFDEVERIAAAITPVPGGVGGVTSSVLIGHVVMAAKRMTGKEQ